MTIQIANNNPRISYTATGGQTAFPTSFAFFVDGDINVYINDVLKTLTTDYTVTGGNGLAGTVTLVTGATAGDIIVLTRDVELERTTDFPTSGPFQVASLNVELDKLIAMIADMRDLADRGLRLSDSDTSAALVLADKDARKGTVLAFNTVTGAVEVGPTIADTNTVAQIKADIALLADIQDGTVATNAITTVSSISSDVTTVSSNNTNVTTVAGETANMQSIVDNLTAVQNAATNATTATTKAGEAAASATAAATSETNAATSETNAATSATNASSSASAASTSASASATSATAAASSATAAATSETNAGTSETNAASSATTANSYANAAAISSLNAASSESNAAASATSASAAQTAAESARDSALASFDSFDDRYLGAKTSDPTVDNDGDALVAGALYFNSTDGEMKVYNGTSWVDAYADGATLVAKAGDTMTGNLSFGDNNKAIFGAGSDLQIYHDGSNSYVTDQGTGGLYLRGSSEIALRSASNENIFLGLTDGAAYVYHNGSAKLNTTATGINVAGNATFDDNGKAIFGAGSDLQIYHDGSNSYIDETAAGNLFIRAHDRLYLQNYVTGENHLVAIANDAVKLYYDNAQKLATTATGIDVTGTVTADGLSVSGASAGTVTAATFTNTTSANGTRVQAVLQNVSSVCGVNLVSERVGANFGADFIVETSGTVDGTDKQRLRVAETGDISFYEDTGTTPKLFWDTSAERLGIGTILPLNKLDLAEAGDTQLRITSTDGNNVRLGLNSSGTVYNWIEANGTNLLFAVGNAERARLDASGNLLVGKTSTSSAFTTAGVDLRPEGRSFMTRSGGPSLYLSRTTSDGNIAEFYKDGTTVGSIGTAIGNAYFAGSSTGITFGSANVYPTNASGTKSNGTLTLGSSSNRFDDLHLGGVAYISDGTSSGTQTVVGGNYYIANSGAYPIVFQTNSTERARLDTSANLLVGTTSDNVANQTGTTQGVRIAGGSIKNIQVASTGTTAYFNRLSTDGSIAEFRKNGSAVGHISTVSGGMYLGTASNAIRFTSTDIRPVDVNGTNTTNTVDLGDSASRFKDLYLGGTAYASSAVIEGSSGLGNLEATLQVSSTETMAAGTGGTISLMGDDGTGTQRTFGMIKGAKGNASSGAFGGGLEFYTRTNGVGDAVQRMLIDQQGRVGIGTSSPASALHIVNSGLANQLRISNTTADATTKYGTVLGSHYTNSEEPITGMLLTSSSSSTGGTVSIGGGISSANAVNNIVFYTAANNTTLAGSERARLDASGNLLVGTTTAGTTGSQLRANGQVRGNSTSIPIFSNRISSDGILNRFQKNGTTVGGIGTFASSTFIYGTGAGVTDTGLIFSDSQIVPCNGSGVGQDDAFDLGTSISRFDDVFATNGTINTSDGDEKQDIEELTEVEKRVAIAAKGLLRKFRWKSRVEEKGDDARIHFGIIAQDLQAAFEAEGLDAGRYAMFINSTWTDEETGEERSRMGVRYNELLAFIIAAI